MSVTVTTYSDDDGDDALDADEMRTILTTKITKLVSYEQQSGQLMAGGAACRCWK